jgi:hypothetical protein
MRIKKMNMLPTSLAPKTMAEATEFAKLIAQSNMVPAAYKGKPADVLVAVQWGAELGLAPLQALQNIACINGKPSVYGDAALALVRGSSVCEDVEEVIEGDGEQMVATCIAKRKGCKPVIARFSVFDAKAAGLWKKQGPWTQYPRRMLQMRARGFALRDAFPDVLKGLITAEEAADYPRQERDITPSNPLDKFAAQVVQQIEPPRVDETPSAIEGEVVTAASVDASDVAADVVPDDVPPPTIGRRLPLILPGGEVNGEFDDIGEWVIALADMMDRVHGSKKYEPREKMTKLRELKEANEATIKSLDVMASAEITKRYSKHLRALGAEMNDKGENDAP